MKSLIAKIKDVEIKMENLDKHYFDDPNFGYEKYNKYILQIETELKGIHELMELREETI